MLCVRHQLFYLSRNVAQFADLGQERGVDILRHLLVGSPLAGNMQQVRGLFTSGATRVMGVGGSVLVRCWPRSGWRFLKHKKVYVGKSEGFEMAVGHRYIREAEDLSQFVKLLWLFGTCSWTACAPLCGDSERRGRCGNPCSRCLDWSWRTQAPRCVCGTSDR